jgi:hypothetical protein
VKLLHLQYDDYLGTGDSRRATELARLSTSDETGDIAAELIAVLRRSGNITIRSYARRSDAISTPDPICETVRTTRSASLWQARETAPALESWGAYLGNLIGPSGANIANLRTERSTSHGAYAAFREKRPNKESDVLRCFPSPRKNLF